MDEERLKKQIGMNIAAYRKRSRLTQVGLAEKLNYSDKAVSKWERGESAPDIATLVQLADAFDITVNELIEDPNRLPENPGAMERVMVDVVEKRLKRKANKRIILGLTTVLVWFVALLLFVIISSLETPKSWMAFIYAIPANAIVLLSLRSAWRDFRWNQGLVSAIIWGALLSIYTTLLVFFNLNIWKVFLLGIPGQAAVLLWFKLYHKQPKEGQDG